MLILILSLFFAGGVVANLNNDYTKRESFFEAGGMWDNSFELMNDLQRIEMGDNLIYLTLGPAEYATAVAADMINKVNMYTNTLHINPERVYCLDVAFTPNRVPKEAREINSLINEIATTAMGDEISFFIVFGIEDQLPEHRQTLDFVFRLTDSSFDVSRVIVLLAYDHLKNNAATTTTAADAIADTSTDAIATDADVATVDAVPSVALLQHAGWKSFISDALNTDMVNVNGNAFAGRIARAAVTSAVETTTTATSTEHELFLGPGAAAKSNAILKIWPQVCSFYFTYQSSLAEEEAAVGSGDENETVNTEDSTTSAGLHDAKMHRSINSQFLSKNALLFAASVVAILLSLVVFESQSTNDSKTNQTDSSSNNRSSRSGADQADDGDGEVQLIAVRRAGSNRRREVIELADAAEDDTDVIDAVEGSGSGSGSGSSSSSSSSSNRKLQHPLQRATTTAAAAAAKRTRSHSPGAVRIKREPGSRTPSKRENDMKSPSAAGMEPVRIKLEPGLRYGFYDQDGDGGKGVLDAEFIEYLHEHDAEQRVLTRRQMRQMAEQLTYSKRTRKQAARYSY